MNTAAQSTSNPIRVMLVDDSAVIRGMIARELRAQDNIEVVGTASDGQMAISQIQRTPADVILLDIEMPVKDGLEALPELLKVSPQSHVIMVSTLTQRNASISLKALNLGATDYIAKPSSTHDKNASEVFYKELIHKVNALGRARKHANMAFSPIASQPLGPPSLAPAVMSAMAMPNLPIRMAHPQVLGIASSTGGPQALLKLLSLLKDSLAGIPVLMTQHMPATFTKLLAEHISNDTGLNCHEAEDGEKVVAGQLYLAPGDYHLTVKRADGGKVLALNQNPPVNFCRPAADPMFDSIADCYGRDVLALVLTGMGNDGCAGAKRIKDAGGQVLIQDKETSVVWGMPGAIAKVGFQDATVPLETMAELVKRAVR